MIFAIQFHIRYSIIIQFPRKNLKAEDISYTITLDGVTSHITYKKYMSVHQMYNENYMNSLNSGIFRVFGPR